MSKKKEEKIKVVILDDEKDVCHFLKEFLLRRGFDTHTALTTNQAMQLIKKVKPDIAILDIYLAKGKLNGLDVLKFIKENKFECVPLMVTRADDQSLVEESKKAGAFDYLTKPLTLLGLEKALTTIVKKIKGAK